MKAKDFEADFKLFCQQSVADGRFVPSREDWRAVLDEDSDQQHYDSHYVYHTSWAARILVEAPPKKHVDVSSLLYFSTIISAVVPVDFYDIRPIKISLPNFSCGRADLAALPFADSSVESLSCMHVIEHVGLGRYGDAVDASGDRKAAVELTRSLAPSGQLLMVAPCGRPAIMWNAHRIYSYGMMIEMFAGLRLQEFSLFSVRMDKFVKNADPELVQGEDDVCGACGMWRFTKE